MLLLAPGVLFQLGHVWSWRSKRQAELNSQVPAGSELSTVAGITGDGHSFVHSFSAYVRSRTCLCLSQSQRVQRKRTRGHSCHQHVKQLFIENQFSWFGFYWKSFHTIYNQLKLIISPQIYKKSSNSSLVDQISMQNIKSCVSRINNWIQHG